MDFLVWQLGPLVFTIVCWELGKWLHRRLRMKYRWKCKQCGFKVQSNNWRDFEISKTSHNHISTREYK